ncbi:MAG TPA: helix-turn-helix domain-containing protein [Williamwhitmania sp.]|nr:helix-turn-helix domain-containing protein [Williamwhitmania sp.]
MSLEKFSKIDQCPIRNVLDRFGDKWSILVLLLLSEQGTMRFSAINSAIVDISQKMLTVTLRTLEADGLIARQIYPQIPPKVEYSLTERGSSLIPLIRQLAAWAVENMQSIKASREAFETKSA